MATTLTVPRIEPVSARRPAPGRRVLDWLPLAVILLAQLALTVRLIPHGYASTDEGRYIDAGHALIHELFHGGGSPYYETYFSGAPDLYSPLAAIADFAGGLAAVRLMSALFMEVAAVMLYLTGRRLFGHWSAVTASAVWAGLSLTQVVGRNAIYDAMALMLMSVAAYCASRSKEARWLLLVPLGLLAADAAKYIVLLFNPTVILIAAYQLRGRGVRAVLGRVAVLGGTTVLELIFAAFLAGSAYVKGIMFTTLDRKSGANVILGASPAPMRVILTETWQWFGLVILVAFLAVALASMFPRERAKAWLLLTLAITSILVTLEALHLHSDESSGRHDAFAAWFGCIAVGYAASLLVSKLGWNTISRSVLGVLAAGAVIVGGALYTFGPNVFENHGFQGNTEVLGSITANYSILKPYLGSGQRYLISGNDDYAILYNDRDYAQWWNIVDDSYIKYPIPGRGGDWHGIARGRVCIAVKPGCMYLEGDAGYLAAIHAHAFAVITLSRMQLAADEVIVHAAETTRGYYLLTTAGGGPTWIYLPDYEHTAPG